MSTTGNFWSKWGGLLFLILVFVLVCLVAFGQFVIRDDWTEEGVIAATLAFFLWVVPGFFVWMTRGPIPDSRLKGAPTNQSAKIPDPSPPKSYHWFFVGVLALCWIGLLGFFSIYGIFFSLFFMVVLFQGLLVGTISRQEEVARVLTMASNKGSDQAEAVRALAADSTQYGLKRFLLLALSWIVVPGYAILRNPGWVWSARLRRLAHRLESGQSLPEALSKDPQLVPPEFRVASKPELGLLALASLERWEARQNSGLIWLEIYPRIVYPAVVLAIVCQFLVIQSLYIAPKIKRLLQELGLQSSRFSFDSFLNENTVFICLACIAVIIFFLLAIIGISFFWPGFRWWMPLGAYLYRNEVIGDFLKRLGALLAQGHTESKCLGALGESPGFPRPLRRKILAIEGSVLMGRPLVESLVHQLGLGRSQKALLEAAQKNQQLPWILKEMGDRMIKVTLVRLQWVSHLLLLGLVLVIGAVVGLVCYGLFSPLLEIMEAME